MGQSHNNLGFILDSRLTFDEHVSKLLVKCNSLLNPLKSLTGKLQSKHLEHLSLLQNGVPWDFWYESKRPVWINRELLQEQEKRSRHFRKFLWQEFRAVSMATAFSPLNVIISNILQLFSRFIVMKPSLSLIAVILLQNDMYFTSLLLKTAELCNNEVSICHCGVETSYFIGYFHQKSWNQPFLQE